ncbi:MAG: enoyl-CoA hydratase-related protein, partial [Acidimicrobiia bacterium]
CSAVSADDEVVDTALDYAGRLAAMSTDALITTRRLIHGSRRISFAEALDAEKEEQGRLGSTPEHAEGVAAFLEKRKPDFRKS